MEFNILYIKALHIIFVTTWFAGLFYIVRLFIYHAEARRESEPASSILQKQYKLMEWRLWYMITWPSAILTLILGSWLVYWNSDVYGLEFLWQPWLLVKLGMVAALFLYQLYCHLIFKQLQRGDPSWSSAALRIWNEVATLFLFAIVFLVMLRSAVDWLWGLAALVVLSLVMMVGIKLYGKARKKNEIDEDSAEETASES